MMQMMAILKGTTSLDNIKYLVKVGLSLKTQSKFSGRHMASFFKYGASVGVGSPKGIHQMMKVA